MQFLIAVETLKVLADWITALSLAAIAIHEIFGSNGWRQCGRSTNGR